jgi:hypothetical protein
MAKRNFDFKQFMLQKGDRVGIIVAGSLTVLLVALGITLMASADGSLTPGGNAEKLQKITDQKKKDLDTRTLPKEEADKQALVPPDLIVKDKPLYPNYDARKFDFADGVFLGEGDINDKRRAPGILVPTEMIARVVNVQAAFYMFSGDHDEIGVLVNPPPHKEKDKKDKGGALAGMYGRMQGNKNIGSMPSMPMMGAGGGPGRPGGPPGGSSGGPPGGKMPGSGAYGGMYGPSMQSMRPGGTSPDDKKVIKFVKFDELDKLQGAVFAENLLPMRVAEIVGSFPLKDQMEEFQKALHVRTSGELFDTARPQFAFLGLNVQKRILAADGKRVIYDWADLDLDQAYKWWALNNGRRYEPEDPDLQPILQWSSGLVMKRPQQVAEASQPYPPLEKELASISASLKKIQESGKKTTAPKNPFVDSSDLSPFKEDAQVGGYIGGKEMMEGFPGGPGGGKLPPGGGQIRPGTGAGGGGLDGAEGSNPTNPYAGQHLEAPDCALIRFIDILIEPGMVYQYRVQIRMTNPNWKRKDVREDLSRDKELISPWYELPEKLFVPEEVEYFAVDMKQVENETKVAHKKFQSKGWPEKNQAVLQIHRWVPAINVRPSAPTLPVGEWSIAERVPVYRGEHVGLPRQVDPVKIPVWMYDQAAFALAANPTGLAQFRHLIAVPFSAGRNDALLVDFSGGEVPYKLSTGGDKDGGSSVTDKKDKAPTELLILTAEGKLIVRDGDLDKEDKTRTDRVEQWHKRIEELEKKGKPDKKGDGLFDNKGPGGGAGGGGGGA